MSRQAKLINVPMQEFLAQIEKAVTLNMPANAKVQIYRQDDTKPQLLALISSLDEPYRAVDDAHTSLTNLINARDAADAGVLNFANGYTGAMKAVFGDGPEVEAKYAIPTKKAARQLTIEQKLAKKAKAKATRDLRGTKGKRQKEEIQGHGHLRRERELAVVAAVGAGGPCAGGHCAGRDCPARARAGRHTDARSGPRADRDPGRGSDHRAGAQRRKQRGRRADADERGGSLSPLGCWETTGRLARKGGALRLSAARSSLLWTRGMKTSRSQQLHQISASRWDDRIRSSTIAT